MWRHLLPAIGAAGRRALAPDLPGFGDSAPDRPGTWQRRVEAIERFRSEQGLERVVLMVHDTGGGIALHWACEHPGAIAGLVISNTSLFPDYEWHDIARVMRTPMQGEALLDSLSRDGLAALLREVSTGIDDAAIDEYWKLFSTLDGRRATLELFRSFDLAELGPDRERLARLGVPALVLWGDRDDFLPREYAQRFAGEIPGAELVRLDCGHFLFEDEPERCAEAVIGFLERAAPRKDD